MIRRAQQGDIPQIAAIEEQMFSIPWSQENFAEALCNPNAQIWVEEGEEGVAGYLVLYTSLDEGEITNVAVTPSARRGGIGTRLLDTAKDYVEQQGVGRLVLEVRVSNEPAKGLYQKNGFKELGFRKGFYQKPKEDAIIMAWEK